MLSFHLTQCLRKYSSGIKYTLKFKRPCSKVGVRLQVAPRLIRTGQNFKSRPDLGCSHYDFESPDLLVHQLVRPPLHTPSSENDLASDTTPLYRNMAIDNHSFSAKRTGSFRGRRKSSDGCSPDCKCDRYDPFRIAQYSN